MSSVKKETKHGTDKNQLKKNDLIKELRENRLTMHMINMEDAFLSLFGIRVKHILIYYQF